MRTLVHCGDLGSIDLILFDSGSTEDHGRLLDGSTVFEMETSCKQPTAGHAETPVIVICFPENPDFLRV